MPISLRARKKLRTYSSFENWNIAEQQTLKQVENTRKIAFIHLCNINTTKKNFYCVIENNFSWATSRRILKIGHTKTQQFSFQVSLFNALIISLVII